MNRTHHEPVELSDGILTVKRLEEMGISRQQVHRLTNRGKLLKVGRGLYSRTDATVTENHTIAQVFARVPDGVLCLASALQYHNLTTQSPWQVWLMIDARARQPRVDYPPLRVIRSSGAALTSGIEEHCIEGVTVRVTNPAKTVADCFKYRNKIGLAVAMEALKEFLGTSDADKEGLRRYASICRVEHAMRPYLEAFSL